MLAKTVMVLADGEMVMLALPAAYQVDVEKAGSALGAREIRLPGGGIRGVLPRLRGRRHASLRQPLRSACLRGRDAGGRRNDSLQGWYPHRHDERHLRGLR